MSTTDENCETRPGQALAPPKKRARATKKKKKEAKKKRKRRQQLGGGDLTDDASRNIGVGSRTTSFGRRPSSAMSVADRIHYVDR